MRRVILKQDIFWKLIKVLLASGLLLASCRTREPTGRPEDPTAIATAPQLFPVPTTPTPHEIYVPLAGRDVPTQTPDPSPTASLTPSPVPTSTPAFPVYQGPPIDRDHLGIQVHIHREDMSWIVGHLRSLGVGLVKVQVSWKLYQPEPDRYSDERFAELDSLVRLVTADESQPISVLLSVSKAPEWSRSTTDLDGPPGNYDLLLDFMRHLAGRYRGRVGAYELWNEPNLRREWNGASLSAADFARLVQLGADGVRSIDPAAAIISGAPAPTGINDGIEAIDDRVYLHEMLASGIADHVDFIGVHPYGWANSPDSTAATPDGVAPSHNSHASFFFGDTLHDYRNILLEHGVDKRLWATEFGWGSFDQIGPPPPGTEFMAHVDEWQQAIYTLRAIELAGGWDWIGPMVIWNLNFGPLLGTEFAESGYSLLRPDGSLRPVYESLAAAPKR